MKDDKLYEKFAEKKLSREEIFEGVLVHLVKDRVMLPNGEESTREVVLHNGAVCVVAINEKDEIIMERQFEYPFDEVVWEIPAGKLEKGESSPLEAAKRELKEETGYTSESYVYLGEYYPSPAVMRERLHMYLATGLVAGERNLDPDEFLDVVAVPFERVVKMILDGEIPDGKTQAAVLKVFAMRNL